MDHTDNAASRELGYCPCCGYRTLTEGPPGSREECPVCRWVDDGEQFADPDRVAGANPVSLRTARQNVLEHGTRTADAEGTTRVAGEQRDPNWPY